MNQPLGVRLIVLLHYMWATINFLIAALLTLFAIELAQFSGPLAVRILKTESMLSLAAFAAVAIVIGAILVWIGRALFRLHIWAWRAALLLAVIFAMAFLLVLVTGPAAHPFYTACFAFFFVMNTACALYLALPSIRAVFSD